MGKRHSRAEISGYLDEFKDSGLSRVAYCEEIGVKYNTFSKWLQMYATVSQPDVMGSFVELEPEPVPIPEPTSNLRLRLKLQNGTELEFYQMPDLSLVKALIGKG